MGTENRSDEGATIEPLAIFPGSPLSAWLDRLKRDGFAPKLERDEMNGRVIVTVRKQRKGLPGPIPKGVTVKMR